MSEQAPEQQAPPAPNPDAPSGGPETTPPQPGQPQATADTSDEQTFPIRLVKRPTGDVHWSTTDSRWETITHAETGEPNSEYVLLATIDGADVPLASYNAGRIESVVGSQQQAQAQQQSGS